jgi:hypothetical protein
LAISRSLPLPVLNLLHPILEEILHSINFLPQMLDLIRVLARLVPQLRAAHLLLVIKLLVLDVLQPGQLVLEVLCLGD